MKRVSDGNTARDYSYTVPHTGVTLHANNLQKLFELVREHLNSNGFESAVITQAEIEHDWCSKNENSRGCHEEAPHDRQITLHSVVNFTRTMFSNISNGGRRVTQVEANERSSICCACPGNIQAGGCVSCLNSGAASAVVGFLIGDRNTINDDKLMSCAYCGCLNKAQVWFPLEDLQSGMSQTLRDSLPSQCWKK